MTKLKPLTFQQMIQQLMIFWEQQGCIVHQGYDLEVGAGTFNPVTLLRCLGPEPYNAVYVEPSRRPKDGRYGDNPNRLQLFHQFQVLMKPSPHDIQQLYLRSLEALGLDLSMHDIRFVHDDWESPTLGAFGLGWEVWCDGMEITQFTYFQAAGDLTLSPISVELAYGLERLAMFLQNVDSLFAVQWNDTYTLHDIIHETEVEWSHYNFKEASVEMWKRHFVDYEQEVSQLVAKKLPLPAYDFVLKASHAFNILEARGAISVTERTLYIARIRHLTHLVAKAFVAIREQQGFPLCLPKRTKTITSSLIKEPLYKEETTDFLLEIGSEQLPATFIPLGIKQLSQKFSSWLQQKNLSFSHIETYGTPQRLSILIYGLATRTKAQVQEKKGPPISTAFTQDGHLSSLGEGFLRSLSLEKMPMLSDITKGSISALSVQEVKGIPYLFYRKEERSISTFSLLQEALADLLLHIDFPKKMRWGDGTIAYPRPIHWIVALLGPHVIPFVLGDIQAGCRSKGHAQRDPHDFPIEEPKTYLDTLRKHFVLADPQERRAFIEKQIETSHLIPVAKERILAQVTFLTEWPQIAIGTFADRFLQAPPEVLISEMVEHQKYFPTVDAQGNLQTHFLITADNALTPEIIHGNQRVLSARLSDGVFLYEQDVCIPLEHYLTSLHLMTFEQSLGSMFAKVERIIKHAETLHQKLGLAEASQLLRAARLCKSDLASLLVGEFPELQGVAGKYYARAQGEEEEVATAIEEHWMPKSENAPIPQTPCGIIVSLADKIDNLLGYFSAGLKPTSSSDPYALKRQTFGLLRILVEHKLSLSLRTILEENASLYPSPITSSLIDEILHFITQRAKSFFEERSFPKEIIEASLQGACLDPYQQYEKMHALMQCKNSEAFLQLFEVYKRVKGLLTEKTVRILQRDYLIHPAEQALLETMDRLQKILPTLLKKREFILAFHELATLQGPLAALLAQVQIHVEESKLRESRIALIQEVFTLCSTLIDFSKIRGEKIPCLS